MVANHESSFVALVLFKLELTTNVGEFVEKEHFVSSDYTNLVGCGWTALRILIDSIIQTESVDFPTEGL